MLARAIHRLSGRLGNFVRSSVGSLPEHLLEAELLGHVRGAFTGADRERKGLIENANRGTFQLEEIGIAGERLQQLCLDLTEPHPVIRPLGASRDIPVDVRFIGATNEDLGAATRERRFRADLLDRFGWSVITVPPLRERPDEIGPLTDLFLAAEAAKWQVRPARLDRSLRTHFRKARWAGNVRHLQKVCEWITTFHSGEGLVTLEDIPPGLCDVSSPFLLAPSARRDIESIKAAVARHGGNRTHAARELGCSPRTVQRALRATSS